MQMRKMYYSTDKMRRAQEARKDAEECERAGFRLIADINRKIADSLDPVKDIDDI